MSEAVPGESSRTELAEALREVELRPGDEGPAVARLQWALIALAYLTTEQIQSGMGVYGPKTAAAVRLFQSEWGVQETGEFGPATRAALRHALSGAPRPGGWDGRRPAPGTIETRTWIPVEPPTRGDVGRRSGRTYAQVLDQFAVETNPRYAPRNGNTFAHVLVWDVTSALGVEIPHWVDPEGAPVHPGHGRELTAVEVVAWLRTHGPARGWRQVDAQQARVLAGQGHPVVVARLLGQDDARLGLLRPPEDDPGEWVTAAGPRCANRGPLEELLGGPGVERWVHDRGTVAPAPEVAPAGTRREVRRELHRGDSGEDVLWLQESLVALGDLSRADMETGPGLFGPRTEQALKALQARTGVPQTGHLGPLTRAALNASLKQPSFPEGWVPQVTLERGAAGRFVWALQNALLRLELLDWDAFVSAPGEYGPRTETAVRTLQLRSGLTPTGVYGPKTREALRAALKAGKLEVEESLPEQRILGAERAIVFALNPPPGEGPNAGSWHGASLALVREAYRSERGIHRALELPTPREAYEALNAQGRVHTEGTPPRGALVFFRRGLDGAVAIALGDGRCVGVRTRGAQTDVRPSSTRTYLGWATPA